MQEFVEYVYESFAQYHGLEYEEAKAFIEDSGIVQEIRDLMPEYVYDTCQRITLYTDGLLRRNGAALPPLMVHEWVECCDREDLVHTNPWRYDPASKAWVKA